MQFNFDKLNPEAQQRIAELKAVLTSKPSLPIKLNFKIIGMITGAMDSALTRDGRISFWKWLYTDTYGFEVSSSHDLRIEDLYRIQQWADPKKVDDVWTYSMQFITDLNMISSGFDGIRSPKTTTCTMCKNGTVNVYGGGKKSCACCQGNWKACALCATLGNY